MHAAKDHLYDTISLGHLLLKTPTFKHIYIVGNALTAHDQVNIISFTGSVPVGATVAKNAADTSKKITLELGGKSPFIVLPDADLQTTAQAAVMAIMTNSGQNCGAASRTLVPASRKDEFVAAMKAIVEMMPVGDQKSPMSLGPVISAQQFERVQEYIKKGIEEGATLITGGLGRPDSIEKGYYVKPTIFADVTNDMTIAREEIFGPVASVITYETVEDAIEIANDSDFGLAGYVFGADHKAAQEVARRISSGYVGVNTIQGDFSVAWGGYRRSGVGREWGTWGIEEYLETKALPNWFAK